MTKASSESPRSFLAEVQALRAVAVLLVVIYHAFPAALPGGYVGVDAFFVISGFLITSHLVREIESSGKLELGRFWERRIRRLLPASFFVLGCSLGLMALLAPRSLWPQFLEEARASGGYFLNWHLSSASVAYLAEDRVVSPFEHYWSLGVEEQFYFLWPWLMLGALGFARLRAAGKPFDEGAKRVLRSSIAVLVSLVFFLGLAASIFFTRSFPEQAYFWTHVRSYEFAAGALLSVVGTERGGVRLRAVLSWLGTTTLVASGLFFSARIPFPGAWALLPTLATALVIFAGAPDCVWAPNRLYRVGPLRHLGDLSYSLYLWHMPLVVLLPRALTGTPEILGSLAALATTYGLSVLSKRYVEDRFRSDSGGRRRNAYLGALATPVLIALSTLGLGNLVQADPTASVRHSCFGADAARATASECEELARKKVLLPEPERAKADRAWTTCMVERTVADVRICETGVPRQRAKRTVLLVGDSHAEHWLPTLDALAESQGLHILRILKSACPFTAAEPSLEPKALRSCREWNRRVLRTIAEHEEVSWMFTSASAYNPFRTTGSASWQEAAARGYEHIWQSMPGHVQRIFVFRDLPRPRADVVRCLEKRSPEARLTPHACSQRRAEALLLDPLVLAARTFERKKDARVRLVDFSEEFCDDKRCDAVVSHALVYRDKSHMTATFARTLAPNLEEILVELDSGRSESH